MTQRSWSGLVLAMALATGVALAFAPLGSSETCVATAAGERCTSSNPSLLEMEGPSVLAVLGFPALVAAVPVLIPSRRSAQAVAVVLTAATVLAAMSVGVFLLPTVVLAWAAAVWPSKRAPALRGTGRAGIAFGARRPGR